MQPRCNLPNTTNRGLCPASSNPSICQCHRRHPIHSRSCTTFSPHLQHRVRPEDDVTAIQVLELDRRAPLVWRRASGDSAVWLRVSRRHIRCLRISILSAASSVAHCWFAHFVLANCEGAPGLWEREGMRPKRITSTMLNCRTKASLAAENGQHQD